MRAPRRTALHEPRPRERNRRRSSTCSSGRSERDGDAIATSVPATVGPLRDGRPGSYSPCAASFWRARSSGARALCRASGSEWIQSYMSPSSRRASAARDTWRPRAVASARWRDVLANTRKSPRESCATSRARSLLLMEACAFDPSLRVVRHGWSLSWAPRSGGRGARSAARRRSPSD